MEKFQTPINLSRKTAKNMNIRYATLLNQKSLYQGLWLLILRSTTWNKISISYYQEHKTWFKTKESSKILKCVIS